MSPVSPSAPKSPLKPSDLRWEPEGASVSPPATGKVRTGMRISLIAQVPAGHGKPIYFMIHGQYKENPSDTVGFRRQIAKVQAPVMGQEARAVWTARMPAGFLKPVLHLSADFGLDGTASPAPIEIPYEEDANAYVADIQLKTEDGSVAKAAYSIHAGGTEICKGSTDAEGRLSANFRIDQSEYILAFHWEGEDYEVPLQAGMEA